MSVGVQRIRLNIFHAGGGTTATNVFEPVTTGTRRPSFAVGG